MAKFLQTNENEIRWAQEVAAFAEKHGDAAGAEEIRRAIGEYAERKITVAVVGLNKRGKSTFCNALLGRHDDTLAPVAWEPATGVISSFRNSADRECAEVCFEDGHKEEIAYEHIRDYVLEQKNPQNSKQVERVDVFGKFDLDDDIVLLDLPGDDSIHAYHSQIVYNYLPNADIVLFMSSATDPIHKAELDLLRKVGENDRRKIFFIVNKADDCDDDELAQAKMHNANVLQNANIPYENRLYCISAQQMLETGSDEFDFSALEGAIRDYLSENKLNLQRDGFRNLVCNAASGLCRQLELRAESSKLSDEELQRKIEELKTEGSRSQEMLDHGIQEFSDSWKNMIDTFSACLPELEDETKKRVKSYIDAIPMMALSKKTVQELPGKITEIMEQVLAAPLATVEEQVKGNLEKLDQQVKSVDKYLSDNVFEIRHTSGSSPVSVGSVVTGGTFIGLGGVLMTVASIPATWSGITVLGVNIGSFLATAGGVITAPLAALAAPLFLGGSVILALPILGWVRSVKRKKDEIRASAEVSVTRAFCNIRTSKLPLMEQQGNTLVMTLRDTFRNRMEQARQELEKALDERRHMLGAGDEEKLSADCEFLADLLNRKAE